MLNINPTRFMPGLSRVCQKKGSAGKVKLTHFAYTMMEFRKTVLAFESIADTLRFDHSNETSLAVILRIQFCSSAFYKMVKKLC